MCCGIPVFAASSANRAAENEPALASCSDAAPEVMIVGSGASCCCFCFNRLKGSAAAGSVSCSCESQGWGEGLGLRVGVGLGFGPALVCCCGGGTSLEILAISSAKRDADIGSEEPVEGSTVTGSTA